MEGLDEELKCEGERDAGTARISAHQGFRYLPIHHHLYATGVDWAPASDYITENMCCVESLEGEFVRGLASEVKLSSILFANLRGASDFVEKRYHASRKPI